MRIQLELKKQSRFQRPHLTACSEPLLADPPRYCDEPVSIYSPEAVHNRQNRVYLTFRECQRLFQTFVGQS